MAKLATLLKGVRTDCRGVAASEYAILSVGIVVIVGAAVGILIEPNNSAFQVLNDTVSATLTYMIDNVGTSR
jgi:Flp pilus assembly pilin Flp